MKANGSNMQITDTWLKISLAQRILDVTMASSSYERRHSDAQGPQMKIIAF